MVRCFKARSNLDENKLNEQTRTLYPDAVTMEKKLPEILQKLGFSPIVPNIWRIRSQSIPPVVPVMRGEPP